jgi:hypothetical protein
MPNQRRCASIWTMRHVDSLLRLTVLALCSVAATGASLDLSNDADGRERSLPPPPQLGPPASEEPFLTRRPRIVRPGTLMTLSGGGFIPGERVVIEFATRELGAARANTSGRFNGKHVRFPRDWRLAGAESIRATGEQSLVHVERPIQVRCKRGYRRRGSFCLAPGAPGFSGP